MKASEMIIELQKLIDKHGDKPVTLKKLSTYSGYSTCKEVEVHGFGGGVQKDIPVSTFHIC